MPETLLPVQVLAAPLLQTAAGDTSTWKPTGIALPDAGHTGPWFSATGTHWQGLAGARSWPGQDSKWLTKGSSQKPALPGEHPDAASGRAVGQDSPGIKANSQLFRRQLLSDSPFGLL